MPASPTLSSPWSSRLSILIGLTAAVAILGSTLAATSEAWRDIFWIAKPLATALIFLLAWRMPMASTPYRSWVLAGIALSLIGDVWLMLPADHFVAGLLSFLLAHLCFITAFCGDVRLGRRPLPWLLCLAFGAGYLALLWPHIGAGLRLPVLVYMVVLASMAGQALGRAMTLRDAAESINTNDLGATSARIAAVGALLFMLSDSLLAWNRFRAALPLAALWVLATYYGALWLIAHSVQDSATSRARRMQ